MFPRIPIQLLLFPSTLLLTLDHSDLVLRGCCGLVILLLLEESPEVLLWWSFGFGGCLEDLKDGGDLGFVVVDVFGVIFGLGFEGDF